MEIYRYNINGKLLPYNDAIKAIAEKKAGREISAVAKSVIPSMLDSSQKSNWIADYEEVIIEVDPEFEIDGDIMFAREEATVTEHCPKWDWEKDEKIDGEFHFLIGAKVSLTQQEQEEAVQEKIKRGE